MRMSTDHNFFIFFQPLVTTLLKQDVTIILITKSHKAAVTIVGQRDRVCGDEDIFSGNN